MTIIYYNNNNYKPKNNIKKKIQNKKVLIPQQINMLLLNMNQKRVKLPN